MGTVELDIKDSYYNMLEKIQQNFDALIHLLGGDALAGAVEVEAAGAEIRAGQAHIAQGRRRCRRGPGSRWVLGPPRGWPCGHGGAGHQGQLL